MIWIGRDFSRQQDLGLHLLKLDAAGDRVLPSLKRKLAEETMTVLVMR